MARTKKEAGKKVAENEAAGPNKVDGGGQPEKGGHVSDVDESSSEIEVVYERLPNKAKSRKRSAGARNSACKRPVPKWKMPIGEFFPKAGSSKEAAEGAPPDEDEADMEVGEVYAPTTADSTVKEEGADTSGTTDEAAGPNKVDGGGQHKKEDGEISDEDESSLVIEVVYEMLPKNLEW